MFLPNKLQSIKHRAAANNEKRDVRLLYIMVLASPRAHYGPQGVRGDSFLAHVMRNAWLLEMR